MACLPSCIPIYYLPIYYLPTCTGTPATWRAGPRRQVRPSRSNPNPNPNPNPDPNPDLNPNPNPDPNPNPNPNPSPLPPPGKTIVVVVPSHGIRYVQHPLWGKMKAEVRSLVITPSNCGTRSGAR